MNASEQQLKDFLESNSSEVIHLSLKPQGMHTTIENGAVNLCYVEVFGNEYTFGGISEQVYDDLVTAYDWRERK